VPAVQGECPYDCAEPSSGTIDVLDLLALLSEWGSAGECNASGSGTVGVVDLLGMLAAWGECLYTLPPNDSCENRAPLTIGIPVSDDTGESNGPDDVGPGCPFFDQESPGQWYCVIGPAGDAQLSAILSIELSDFWDGAISVYCGRCTGPILCVGTCAPFHPLACADFGDPSTAFVSWCAQEGEEYFVLVHSATGGTGEYTLEITNDGACIEPSPECGPPNDDCADAIPIFEGLTDFDTTYATTDGPASPPDTCNDFDETQTWSDIWYVYDATCTGLLTVTTCDDVDPDASSDYDSDLVVYGPFGGASAFDCSDLESSFLACNDDDPDNDCGQVPDFSSTVQIAITAESTYLVRVGGWAEGSAGPGTLSVNCLEGPVLGACCVDGICQDTIEESDCQQLDGQWYLGETCPEFDECRPANDDCQFAQAVTEESIDFDSTFATTDGPALPESCDEGFGLGFEKDLWYFYTPTAAGPSTFDLCVSTFDTRIAIYQGDCDKLVLLACNDDSTVCPNLQSRLTLDMTAGVAVLVRVGGFEEGAPGTLTISQP
jgi:hypothetical protein